MTQGMPMSQQHLNLILKALKSKGLMFFETTSESESDVLTICLLDILKFQLQLCTCSRLRSATMRPQK